MDYKRFLLNIRKLSSGFLPTRIAGQAELHTLWIKDNGVQFQKYREKMIFEYNQYPAYLKK